MPNYPVAASEFDEQLGTGANTTGTEIVASINNLIGANSYGYIRLDTSAIGTDTITSATLHWYHVGYTKSKTVGFSRRITVGASVVLDSALTPPAAGWHSEVLDPGELGDINPAGDTLVQFSVLDPGGLENRSWTIQTWDYTDHSRACYLEVAHAAAGGPTKFSVIR
jgi:hypothetical protein